MAAQPTRVWKVAKRLRVLSKDIIEVCRAEGIKGVENHMSILSPEDAKKITAIFRGTSQDDQL